MEKAKLCARNSVNYQGIDNRRSDNERVESRPDRPLQPAQTLVFLEASARENRGKFGKTRVTTPVHVGA